MDLFQRSKVMFKNLRTYVFFVFETNRNVIRFIKNMEMHEKFRIAKLKYVALILFLMVDIK